MKPKILLPLLIAFSCQLYAQPAPVDSMAQRMSWYGAKVPQSLLFVHYDKTVYTHNEMVWFTAYLLRVNDAKNYHTLSVALVNNHSRKVVVQQRYVMQNCLARGDFRIPDSISTGSYSLIASTNRLRNGQQEEIFIQAITIKTVSEPPFSASLQLVDSIAKDGFYQVKLEGYTKDKMLLNGAVITYTAGKSAPTTVVANERGEYLFRVPVAQVTEKNPQFRAKVAFGKESRELSLKMPVRLPPTVLKFYPEGGYLIAGITSQLGWEARTPEGSPVETIGILFRNNEPVDTVKTEASGLGKFRLHPVKNAVYTMKLVGQPASEPGTMLPAVLPSGTQLSIRDALVNDTLRMEVRTTQLQTLTLLVHDYRQVYASTEIVMDGNYRRLKLPLSEIGKGLCTVTLLDSAGRPVAERLFFARAKEHSNASLAMDKSAYKTREKVSVSLQLTNADGTPSQGFLSVACVQANRLELMNVQNIEQFTYLGSELGGLPRFPLGELAGDPDQLETLLLIKGWRKYTWLELSNLSPKDTIVTRENLEFSGLVTKRGKPLKKPESVAVLGSVISLAATDSTGNFRLDPQMLLLQPDKSLLLSVSGHSSIDYEVALHNPYSKGNQQMAEQADPINDDRQLFAPSTQSLLINRNERSILMKEISITAKKDILITGRTNACGDYVCRFNILNCPNHYNDQGNHPPVVGQQYSVGRFSEVYKGCSGSRLDAGVVKIPGIYVHREFYGSDYSKDDSPLPEYFSTLYWNHGIVPDASGKAEFSFYTSDLTGKFKIIVQGVGTRDVVYSETTFDVSKAAVKKEQ